MIVMKNQKARSLAIVLCFVYFVAFFYLRTFEGDIHELPDSVPHYFTLWMSVILLWIFALYFIYLALNGVSSGKFPGTHAWLPVDCRQYEGALSKLLRSIMFAAALGFFAFPGMLLLYVSRIV